MMKKVQNNYKGKNSSKIKRNIPKRTIALQLIFCVKTWAVNRVTQCLKKAPFSFPAGVQLVLGARMDTCQSACYVMLIIGIIGQGGY